MISVPLDKDLTPRWGAKAIAPIINRTERETYRALESKEKIPGAKKIAGRWMLIPAHFYAAVAA